MLGHLEGSQLYKHIIVDNGAVLPAGSSADLEATEVIDIRPGFVVVSGASFSAEIVTQDVVDVSEGQYEYDEIGNLVRDHGEGTTIEWTPYGKVRSVTKDNGDEMHFQYDASGNRVAKSVTAGSETTTTYYLRDASGNVMATYEGLTLKEQPIYGSSRVGIYRGGTAIGKEQLGHKYYELTNHLGNVMAVITDKIYISGGLDGGLTPPGDPGGGGLPGDPPLPGGGGPGGGGDPDEPQFLVSADVVSVTDYYPFGLSMPGRSYSTDEYRYGFNGKEKDDNGEWGQTHYDYGFRIYNPGIGKFLSVDPIKKKFPFYTPYQFAGNKTIWAVDIDGLEDAIYTVVEDLNGNKSESLIELDRPLRAGPGVLTVHYGYHGDLNNPSESLEETLDRMQLLSTSFMPTIFISAGEPKFDPALELNISIEVGPNATARGRILGFGGGFEVGATGEVFKGGLQTSAQDLLDIRINPNTGLQDPNLNFNLGGDALIFSGDSELTFGMKNFVPEVQDVKFEGAVSILKVSTQATEPGPKGKIELASGAIGPGWFKIKGSLSTPAFNLTGGQPAAKEFNPDDALLVPADNVRVGSGDGF